MGSLIYFWGPRGMFRPQTSAKLGMLGKPGPGLQVPRKLGKLGKLGPGPLAPQKLGKLGKSGPGPQELEN